MKDDSFRCFAAAFLLLAATPLVGQSSPPQGPCTAIATSELVSEIRNLRLTVRQSSDRSNRVYLLVERFRLQSARVESAQRALSSAQSQWDDIAASVARAEAQIKFTQEQLQRTADARERESLTGELKALETNRSAIKGGEEPARQRIARATADLEAEQGRLAAFDSEFDSIIRELRSN